MKTLRQYIIAAGLIASSASYGQFGGQLPQQGGFRQQPFNFNNQFHRPPFPNYPGYYPRPHWNPYPHRSRYNPWYRPLMINNFYGPNYVNFSYRPWW